jgi:hypothetical protein
MSPRTLTVLTLSVLAIAFAPALAQTPAGEKADPAGFWDGAVIVPTGEVGVAVDLARDDDDAWSGTIDVPTMGIRYLDLADLTVDGRSVLIKLTDMPGVPTLNGSVSDDGQKIDGNFIRGTEIFPFTLERKEKPEAFGDLNALFRSYVTPGTPGEGLAGTWRGLLEFGPIRLRLLLKVAATEDGTYLARVEGVDREETVEASSTTAGEDGSVVVEMASVGARFSGTMSEDGSEIAGEWQERGAPLPVTFRRGAPE